MNKDIVTIILGAGFSKPAGLPLAREIDKFFDRDNSDKLLHFSSQEWAWFDYASEADKVNGRNSLDVFACGFLLNEWVAEYKQKVGLFISYEDFYQFIVNNINNIDLWETILEKGLEKFLSIYRIEPQQAQYNLHTRSLREINKKQLYSLINHLIADLLQVRSSEHILQTSYSLFVKFIKKVYKANIITLNHDILFEWLLKTNNIDFDDGYSSENSPLQNERKDKIPVFANVFRKPISLIKLHGSIDNYMYPIGVENGSSVQLTNDYLYFKTHSYKDKHFPYRIVPETGEIIQRFHSEITPSFITGTNKDDIIKNVPMYNDLYQGFKKGIHSSNTLIVFGYSYKDAHINKQIMSAITNGNIKTIININKSIEFPYELESAECTNLKDITEISSIVNLFST